MVKNGFSKAETASFRPYLHAGFAFLVYHFALSRVQDKARKGGL